MVYFKDVPVGSTMEDRTLAKFMSQTYIENQLVKDSRSELYLIHFEPRLSVDASEKETPDLNDLEKVWKLLMDEPLVKKTIIKSSGDNAYYF